MSNIVEDVQARATHKNVAAKGMGTGEGGFWSERVNKDANCP